MNKVEHREIKPSSRDSSNAERLPLDQRNSEERHRTDVATPTPTEAAWQLAAPTPGPWQSVVANGMKMVATADGHKVVAIAGYWPGDDKAEALANLRLIASAPEVLGALQALLAEQLDNTPSTRRARAAVGLATGRAS